MVIMIMKGKEKTIILENGNKTYNTELGRGYNKFELDKRL